MLEYGISYSHFSNFRLLDFSSDCGGSVDDRLLELRQILFPPDFAYSCQHVSACLETFTISEKVNRSWEYGAVNGHQFKLEVEPIFLGIFYFFVPESGANILGILYFL